MSFGGGRSCLSAGAIYFGFLCTIVAILAAINHGFSLNLALSVSGAKVDLPEDWVAIVALGIIGVATFGFGNLVGNDELAAKVKEKPIVLLPVILLIVFVGYVGFVQIDYYMYGGKYHWAAANNKVEVLKGLFSKDKVEKDELNELLRLSVVYRATESVKFLLSKGGDVNWRDQRKIPLLSLAVWQSTVDVVTLLIDKGADVNAIEPNLQRSPLMYTVSYRPGIPQHDAATMNQQQKTIIKKLLSKGADKSHKDKFGKTAAELAKQEGHTSLLSLLQ